jgi:hypothetical protein
MSAVNTSWAYEPLAKPDHERLLRILFDGLTGSAFSGEAAGVVRSTRRAGSRRRDGEPLVTPRRGSVSGDAA